MFENVAIVGWLLFTVRQRDSSGILADLLAEV
jgi:hypothetical protein